MPGRKYLATSSPKYRYGFNGKENDDEVKGEGNQQDYGMRTYDGKLGKFLSVDPITKDYPELTPYQFASNRPIDGIDQDGLEYAKANMNSDATVVRHNSDPVVALKQIETAPDRDRKVIAAYVQNKVRTHAGSVMTSYKQPDAVQKQRNATLQKNYDATVIPADHWTRNTHLNKASENLVEPMVEWAIGEGVGRIIFKGIGLFKPATLNLETITNAIKSGEYKLVDNIANRLAKGKSIKNNQEFNITLFGEGKSKMNIRVETHSLPTKYGGDGVTPVRHMNVEAVDKAGKKVVLANDGHIILNNP